MRKMPSRIYECLSRIGESIIANKDFLTELDREIGDSDHGINMARGFHAVLEKTDPETQDIGAVLKKAGMTLLSTVGGASGPLYGTAYMEAGKVLAGKSELTAEDMKAVLEAAIAGIQKRGKAVKGEKTMLDAIIPASETYAQKIAEGADMVSALEAACESAREGVEYTKTIIATKGRASYLGERSIGHQDPGATSATLTLEAIRDFLKG
ncbi:MAG: dihydroxyacetone kinase subunit L [Synergistaceae bacterium]|nr:dihydroxyacetone kinase subunit L [Synergistaceae bacterium]